MKHYALLDEYGYIIGYSYSDTKGDGIREEVPGGLSSILQDSVRYRLVNGNIIKTDVPKYPPKAGFIWIQGTWVDTRTPESEWALVRERRNKLLSESDWTQLPDVSIETKQLWAQYRQDLRNITTQSDPFNIVWPQPPQ